MNVRKSYIESVSFVVLFAFFAEPAVAGLTFLSEQHHVDGYAWSTIGVDRYSVNHPRLAKGAARVNLTEPFSNWAYARSTAGRFSVMALAGVGNPVSVSAAARAESDYIFVAPNDGAWIDLDVAGYRDGLDGFSYEVRFELTDLTTGHSVLSDTDFQWQPVSDYYAEFGAATRFWAEAGRQYSLSYGVWTEDSDYDQEYGMDIDLAIAVPSPGSSILGFAGLAAIAFGRR